MKLIDKAKSFFTKFEQPVTIPVTNKNVVIITAFIKKGIVTVSYKGDHRRALFDDNTLRNMMHGNDFDKNSYQFFKAVANLLKPLTIK